MKNEINFANLNLGIEVEKQITKCLNLIKENFGKDVLSIYLYGSSLLGGLQKYSDIDIFVVLNRSTKYEEKIKLVKKLLQISGLYMKSVKLPIEMTIINKNVINPWYYPPTCDFQYGEWQRDTFESGIIEPYESKTMPDLAIIITQLLLCNKVLFGVKPEQVFPKIPYQDFIHATHDALPSLLSDLQRDTRNVLLTLARIWCTVATDAIYSKPAAADWAIHHLSTKHRRVLERAKAICIGEEKEYWDDIRELIKPCADYMISEIKNTIHEIKSSFANRSIKIK